MNQNSSKFKKCIGCFTVLTTILISANASAEWSIYGLGTLGGSYSYASDINNSGQVVGSYSRFGIPGSLAFITGPNGVGMTPLGTLGGGHSVATGINDSGQVTGFSSLNNNNLTHSFITGPDGVGLTIIEGLGGTSSWANGINNSGQVVATSYTPGKSDMHAFVTGPNGVGITDLGTLGGDTSALDINESGQIIGSSQIADGRYHAFLYSDGEMLDLSLLPTVLNAGWTNLNVTAINDLGQIVGSGNLHGAQQAFLLSPFSIPEFPIPVPEPQTYAMLLAGLGLLGFMVQRRKKRNLT